MWVFEEPASSGFPVPPLSDATTSAAATLTEEDYGAQEQRGGNERSKAHGGGPFVGHAFSDSFEGRIAPSLIDRKGLLNG